MLKMLSILCTYTRIFLLNNNNLVGVVENTVVCHNIARVAN